MHVFGTLRYTNLHIRADQEGVRMIDAAVQRCVRCRPMLTITSVQDLSFQD